MGHLATKQFFNSYSNLVEYIDFLTDCDEPAYLKILQAAASHNQERSEAPLCLEHLVWIDLLYTDVTKWITFNWDDMEEGDIKFEDIQANVKIAVTILWVRLNGINQLNHN